SSANFSSIIANFNSTAISSGNYIWFNSEFKLDGVALSPSLTTHLYITNATVTFTNGITNYTINIPDAIITFSPGASCGSTSFSQNTWQTTVPASGSISTGQIFLAGVGWQVPANLPGGIKRVTWAGKFYADQPNIHPIWQWAAAVYTTNMSNAASLGVK